jgi:PPK2 family polyphosphate:nucleotide phosphotransferase
LHPYRIAAGANVDLTQISTNDRSQFDGDKGDGKKRLKHLATEIAELQDRLHAAKNHRFLIVLQGMDTAGKDSTIRDIFSRTNPLGMDTVSFAKPSAEELAHDYLWRIHDHAPKLGGISIFNRSHYEDVVVVRVKQLVADEVWQRRYSHIRAFEQMLADEKTVIVKFFLHISEGEQRDRIQERIDIEEKHWKLSEADFTERAFWDSYQQAWSQAISETSTDDAPWYVIPSDKRWYRKLAIAEVIRDALAGLGSEYPAPSFDPTSMKLT